MNEFVFNVRAFLIGLAIGLLYVYVTEPPKTSVVSYPTPINAGKIVYSDDAGNCYQFVATKVACPTDKSAVKQQPMSSSASSASSASSTFSSIL